MIPRLSQARNQSRGFTLIELLVVIAIIAILAAILFPVFAQAREKARIISGVSNIKQINTGILMYTQDNDETLPLAGHGNNIPNGGSSEWQEAIYPLVKSEGAYKDPDDSSGGNPPNTASMELQIAQQNVDMYSATSFLMTYSVTGATTDASGNASRQSSTLAAFSNPADFMLLVEGQRGALGGNVGGFFGSTPDHTGNIVSVWKCEYFQQYPADASHFFNFTNGAGAGLNNLPYHNTGIVVAFLDGHVKFLPTNQQNGAGYLNAHYPWCSVGAIPQVDPVDPNNVSCATKWY